MQVGVHLDGYKDVAYTVTLERGKRTPLPVTLEKKADPLTDPILDKRENRINAKDGAEMVWIPDGDFMMGSSMEEVKALIKSNPSVAPEYFAAEAPQHKVTVSGYYLYKNPVTVRQYKLFCQATKRQMPPAPNFNLNWSKDDHPIVNVSWEDAEAYCTWAGGHLPTEAQWEKASRGPDGNAFPWGNTFDRNKLWCSKNEKGGDAGGTTPVGSFPANGYGLNDMAGNVWEWCSDWYDSGFYGSSRAETANPENTTPVNVANNPPLRVLRGGSWYNSLAFDFRCSFRIGIAPVKRYPDYGFRCVAAADSK